MKRKEEGRQGRKEGILEKGERSEKDRAWREKVGDNGEKRQREKWKNLENKSEPGARL